MNIEWARAAWRDLKRFSTGGTYINFLTEEEGDARIHDAYGSSRELWAADITQLTKGKNTYAECLRLWQEGLPFLSADDRDRILGKTAAEVLRWPEANP